MIRITLTMGLVMIAQFCLAGGIFDPHPDMDKSASVHPRQAYEEPASRSIQTNDLAALSLSWGPNLQPVQGTDFSFGVEVLNAGTAHQDFYLVKLCLSDGTELASSNGNNLQPGQIWTVFVNWTPAEPGPVSLYAKTVLDNDENPTNDQTPVYQLMVFPQEILSMVVGGGDQLLRIPMDMYFQNSLYETLFYANELPSLCGGIIELGFFNNFGSDLVNKPMKVWLGTTTLTDLAAGWIPSTELSLVFDGMLDFPAGANNITVPLEAPFWYLSQQNLVMLVQRPMDQEYFLSSDRFRAQYSTQNRSRKSQSDATPYDPANPPANSTLSGDFPRTRFTWIPVVVGTLQGTVVGANNWPLQNATVQVLGTTFSAQTDYTGVFSLPLPTGTYSVIASATGYNPQTLDNVIISANQTTTVNFTLISVAASDQTAPVNSTLLLSPSPNPAMAETLISYSLEKAGRVKVSIYDVRGRLIRALVDTDAAAGISGTVWDGRNDRGEAVAGGIYLIQMHAGDYRTARKLVLIK